ncbi:hypothetical protein WME97_04025 [Sorangium sp. So ce367]|uniref:hypothetical protein n=1 Tax=Sorangium sp. So ce367 TaxID=3133305 RepID=UPI003F5F3D26
MSRMTATLHVMLSILTWTTVAAAILAQAFITVRLWRSELYSRDQKLLQSALIWLLPVAGSFIVYSGLRQEDDVSRPTPNTEMESDDEE